MSIIIWISRRVNIVFVLYDFKSKNVLISHSDRQQITISSKLLKIKRMTIYKQKNFDIKNGRECKYTYIL